MKLFCIGFACGFWLAVAVVYHLGKRAVERARQRAMARVSRVFAETMAGLYDDVPANWRGMVEQETYEAQLGATWRKTAN